MNDLYWKTFDEIHASEALRQEVLNMTKQEKAAAKRQVPRILLITAIVVLVLVGTAEESPWININVVVARG